MTSAVVVVAGTAAAAVEKARRRIASFGPDRLPWLAA